MSLEGGNPKKWMLWIFTWDAIKTTIKAQITCVVILYYIYISHGFMLYGDEAPNPLFYYAFCGHGHTLVIWFVLVGCCVKKDPQWIHVLCHGSAVKSMDAACALAQIMGSICVKLMRIHVLVPSFCIMAVPESTGSTIATNVLFHNVVI